MICLHACKHARDEVKWREKLKCGVLVYRTIASSVGFTVTPYVKFESLLA